MLHEVAIASANDKKGIRSKSLGDAVNFAASLITVGELIWQLTKFSRNLHSRGRARSVADDEILDYFVQQKVVSEPDLHRIIEVTTRHIWES
jgi:hypothetical protein